ncbi:alpha/beta fold hydrolase [Chryseosolibacter histidini]|nr:alpha/beta hydrolase [Chryseosolibacter histidini]
MATARQALDTAEVVTIGGIKQFITIKGKDRSKPVLLFLHGGPGGSVLSYAHKFSAALEEHFVVVHWDQRETGKTLELNASPVPLTLALFEQDTYELMQLLLKRFSQTKLYLAGHSWGTVLCFSMARYYPDLLYASIAISPVINQLESERIVLGLMKEKALKEKNEEAITQLSKVTIPFQNGDEIYYHRRWLMYYFNGVKNVDEKLPRSYVLWWAERWLAVWNEASAINLLEVAPALSCPLYLLTGRDDYQTNFGITEQYYTKLTAPKKQLFWFEHTAHSVPSSQPKLLQDIIINKILPETFRAADQPALVK